MIVVVIAGGSGTRLWPLSTPRYPKHLLKVNGQTKSLLQTTYDRAKNISQNIYVVSEVSHAHHVKGQLPKLSKEAFIIEPSRRGTANCIVAAIAYIDKLKIDKNEPIAFMAADHYIRDIEGFTHTFTKAGNVSKKEGRIVLVGAEPDYPATGFGYIQKDDLFDEKTFVFNVDSFKEKPSYAIANEYIKSGNYLWNCGYFVGSINVFLAAMKKYSPHLFDSYEKLRLASEDNYEKTYLGFKNDSIDYALIEKVRNLLVVPASFDWMDLGSYTDLHKASSSDEKGNHVHGSNTQIKDVENSFIQNYEDKPVAVIGLDNVIVVNTKDGLVVARKDSSQQIGEISKRFKINKRNIL